MENTRREFLKVLTASGLTAAGLLDVDLAEAWGETAQAEKESGVHGKRFETSYGHIRTFELNNERHIADFPDDSGIMFRHYVKTNPDQNGFADIAFRRFGSTGGDLMKFRLGPGGCFEVHFQPGDEIVFLPNGPIAENANAPITAYSHGGGFTVERTAGNIDVIGACFFRKLN